MSVLKWLPGGIAVAVALVVTLYVATRGDYPVAAPVTGDGTGPSRKIGGVRLHIRTVDGPPDKQTMVVLHGGAGGDLRSLPGVLGPVRHALCRATGRLRYPSLCG